jgi:hypothetical protein
MKKADNFNPGKWLVENKITTQSRLNEAKDPDSVVSQEARDMFYNAVAKVMKDLYQADIMDNDIIDDYLGTEGGLLGDAIEAFLHPEDLDESRLNEDEDLFTYNNRGQGSGSDSRTQKGTPMSVGDIEPGMNLIISYDYNSGQGSGSAGTKTISGKIKSVTSDKVFISIDDAKLNKYTKKYQVMYKRDGMGISKRDITKISAESNN